MYLSRSVSVLWTNGAGLQYWCELSEKKALGTFKLQNVFLSHRYKGKLHCGNERTYNLIKLLPL